MRHDALRLRLSITKEGVYSQHYGPRIAPPLEKLVLRSTTPNEREAELQAYSAQLQSSLDLDGGPLLRAVLVQSAPGSLDQLLLIAHHWILDVVSWRVLLDDLDQAYGQAMEGTDLLLPPVAVSYRTWSQALSEHASTFLNEYEYWRRAIAPMDVPQGLNSIGLVARRRRITIHLDRDTSTTLLQDATERYRAQPQELLLAALTISWCRLSSLPALTLDLESHGRAKIADREFDLSRSVGWFTCLYPLRIEPANADWESAAEAAKAALRCVPSAGIGFGVLRYLQAPEQAVALEQTPPRPLSFNYLGRLDAATDDFLPQLRARRSIQDCGPEQDPRQQLPYAIAVNARIEQGQLRIDFDYAEAYDTPVLADQYRIALQELAVLCKTDGLPPVAYHSSDFSGVALEEGELAALLDDLTDNK